MTGERGPASEADRLIVLGRLGVLDTPPERRFDDLVELAATMCATPMAAVSLIDEDRQWFKAVVGLDVRETAREIAFCAHTIRGTGPLVVGDARADRRFAANPLVTGPPHIRFYAGVPLVVEGQPIGTLCVLDDEPRELDDPRLAALVKLARQATAQLELTGARHDDASAIRRLAAQAPMLTGHDRFAALLGAVPQPVLVFEKPSYRIIDVNAAALSMYGYRRDELLSMTIFDIRPPEDAALLGALIASRDLPSLTARTWRHRRADGVLLDVDIAAHDTVFEGRPGLVSMVFDVTDRRRRESALLHAATHDPLTQLPNRTLFLDRLRAALSLAETPGVAVLFCDLDRFKLVNDTLGHAAGDALLATAATRLRGAVRPEDTVARLGGDEFAVLCTCASPVDAEAVAARLVEVLDAPFSLGGGEYYVGVSIGIAYGEPGSDAEGMLRDGDIAMYQAKAAGRSGFATFDRRARAATVARVALEAELRHALADGGLVPHYQPMVDLRGRDVCSVEALARWDHPRRGLVSPAEFIPVAEETGLITELGRLVLASACADAVRWSAAGRPVVVHVNLSLGQLTGRLVDQVAATLAATGLPAAQLGLEITESMVMADPEQAQAVVRELRDLGVTTALDDFGTGYSSLARLQELPVTTLKLDRTFTARLPSPAGTSVAAAIIDLAHALGVTVVAEGVETAEQLEVLRELGCDGAQGFHLAMPMPAEDLDAWLRSAPRLVR